MDTRQLRARQIQHGIREILLRDWDPIGVRDEPLAQSEYDGYIGGVYRLLASGANEDQLVEHLREIDPVSQPDPETSHLRAVAQHLLALDVRLGETGTAAPLDTFEEVVLQALLLGDDPVLAALRDQLRVVQVSERYFSGSGVFTYFAIPEGVAKVDPASFHIGDLQMEMKGSEVPAEAMLFVRKGRLDSLECYTYSNRWPEQPEITALGHFGPSVPPARLGELTSQRDLDALRRSWRA